MLIKLKKKKTQLTSFTIFQASYISQIFLGNFWIEKCVLELWHIYKSKQVLHRNYVDHKHDALNHSTTLPQKSNLLSIFQIIIALPPFYYK